jgi:hypothetical protein
LERYLRAYCRHRKRAIREGIQSIMGPVQPRPSYSEVQFLSSWGSYLPSRSRSQNPRIATYQKPTATSGQEARDARENAAPYDAATSGNSAVGSDTESKSSPEMGGATPNQVAEETTTERNHASRTKNNQTEPIRKTPRCACRCSPVGWTLGSPAPTAGGASDCSFFDLLGR